MDDAMKIFRQGYEGYVKRAQAIWPEFRTPTLEFTPAMNSTAGRASAKDWKIVLSRAYCLANPKGMLERTIPHEIAHLLAYAIHGRKGWGHSREWVDTFRLLAPEADHSRCHSYGGLRVAQDKIDDAAKRLLKELEDGASPAP